MGSDRRAALRRVVPNMRSKNVALRVGRNISQREEGTVMESKYVLALICCVFAGSCSGQAAPGKQQQIYLDWMGGAQYFHFPEGAQLKITDLNCPSAAVTVSVTCRTATHARCGSWYLGLNGTAKAGPKGDRGIANLNYSGPRGSICTATIVVQSP